MWDLDREIRITLHVVDNRENEETGTIGEQVPQ